MARSPIRYKPLAGVSVNGSVVKHQQGGVLTYLGTGKYRFTFDAPLPDTDYLVTGGADRSAIVIDPANCGTVNIAAKTLAYVDFTTTYGNGALLNFENVNVLIWDADVAFYNPGVYKPIALANIDGRNKVSRLEYGCSIAFGADGLFTLTFDTALPDDEYYIIVGAGDAGTAALRSTNIQTYGTTTITFSTTLNDGVLALADFVDIMVFPGDPTAYTGDYKPHAAISFNGVTPATKVDYGVGTFVRNSTGNFTLTFDVPFADNSYYIVGACGNPANNTFQGLGCPARYETTYAQFTTNAYNGGARNFATSFMMVWPIIPSNFPSDGIDTTETAFMVPLRIPTEALNAPSFQALALVNFPADFVDTQTLVTTTAVRQSSPIQAQQSELMVVGRGRVASPRVRAWTFTLDGHDFYVLRLGDRATLVWDAYSGQWAEWSSERNPFWAVNCGTNWQGGASLAEDYGTSIIAGDDTWGLLWLLDPEQPYDQHPLAANDIQELAFPRIVMGQVPTKGRNVIPCNVVYLKTDNAEYAITGFTPGVTLEISDDGGKTFQDQGTLNITMGTDDMEYTWFSMGNISNPGRLFKFTDNVLARVDSMEMNDDGE